MGYLFFISKPLRFFPKIRKNKSSDEIKSRLQISQNEIVTTNLVDIKQTLIMIIKDFNIKR
jgi:hypothetical protein